MLKWLYSKGLFFASLVLGPLFLLNKRGRLRLADRFGSWMLPAGEYLWFHGASVGEVKGLLPVIQLVRRNLPMAKILLTATSPTGIQDLPAEVDVARLFPFDSAIWLKRALNGVTIKGFITCEAEVWPGVLHWLEDREVPCFLVNAALSDFNWHRYHRYRALFAPVLKGLTKVLLVSDRAGERFRALGVEERQMMVCGNSKYDNIPEEVTEEQRSVLRTELFSSAAPVFILGSLRPGEEEIWFNALRELKRESKNLNVIVAPRHREKFDYFAAQLTASGLPFMKRSAKTSMPSDCSIVLLDSMGELHRLYAIADLVFIGATLVDLGGHNPLEAAAYQVPLVMGPHVTKIREIAQDLDNQGALTTVNDYRQCLDVLRRLINQDSSLQQQGLRAYQVWQTHTGAAHRIAQELSSSLRDIP